MNPELDKLLQEANKALDAKGVVGTQKDAALTDLIGRFNTSKPTEAAPVVEGSNLMDIPFFPDSLVRAVINPALRATATVSEGGAALLARMVGGKQVQDKAFEVARKGIDYPYFGNVKPYGAEAAEALAKEDIEYGDALRKSVMDLGGGLLELGSLYYSPLKLASGGLLSAPLRYAKAVSPFAAPFGIGVGLQEAAKPGVKSEDELATLAKEGSIAFGGAVAGYALLHQGGKAMEWLGGTFMKSETGKLVAEQLSEYAGKARNYVDNLQRKTLGDGLETEYRILQQEVERQQKKLVDDGMNTFYRDTEVDEALLMETVKGNYSKTAQSYYAKRDEMFAQPLDNSGVKEIDMVPVQEVDTKIDVYLKDLYARYAKGEVTQEAFETISNQVGLVRNLPVGEMTPRAAYDIFRSLPNYRSENPVADELIRNRMFAYLQGIKNTFTKEAPGSMDDLNRAFNYADQVRNIVDDPVVHRMRTAGSARNIVDDVMTGKTPTSEQSRVFMEGFTSAQERENYSRLIFNTIINKARQQGSLADSAIIFADNLKWVKGSRASTGQTILTDTHLAQLEQLGNLAKSDFGSFLKGAQEIGQGGGLTPEVNKVIDMFNDLNRVAGIAERTNGFRDYSLLGEEISNIRSVEQLNAILRLIPENTEMKNILGKEILRGVATRHSKNIQTATGELNPDAVTEMVSGMLNDFDRIGGANKDEMFKSLFDGVKIKVGADEISLSSYLLETDKLLRAVQNGDLSKAQKMMTAAHLVTGTLYALTGKSVPAIYHLAQFGKSAAAGKALKTDAAAYDDVVRQLRSENKVRERELTTFGKHLQEVAQTTKYPSLVGGYSAETYINGAEDMLGRPLTEEEKQEIVDDFRALSETTR